jgi:hypothetical protein
MRWRAVEFKASVATVLSRPPLLARLGVLICAGILLAYGFFALADLGWAEGPSAEQAAQAADGPVSASGAVSRIFVERPAEVTVLYLRGADGLQFRLDGDLSRAYLPGDLVRVDGIKTGAVVHAQAVRRAQDPVAAAAPATALGALLTGLVVVDFLAPRAVGRKMPWQGLVARLGAARGAMARKRDEESALDER